MTNRKIIENIIQCILSIREYTENISYEEFIENAMMVEACVFNLSQMGEYVNKINKEYITIHKGIPWFKMRGLRNRIVHDYEGVNLKLIWEIIADDIEPLYEQLKSLID